MSECVTHTAGNFFTARMWMRAVRSFLGSLKRIVGDGYIPTVQDILQVLQPLTASPQGPFVSRAASVLSVSRTYCTLA